MTVNGRRTARTVEFTPVWSLRQRHSRRTSVASRAAYLTGRAAGRLMIVGVEQERRIRDLRRRAAGSFSIDRGGRDSRSWWLTVSIGSVYLEATLARLGAGSPPTRSLTGPDFYRMSDSSKSSTVEDGIIGTAAATPAENGETE